MNWLKYQDSINQKKFNQHLNWYNHNLKKQAFYSIKSLIIEKQLLEKAKQKHE